MRLNPTGDETAELHIALPGDTRAALEAQGIEAPTEVLLLLREATIRELQVFELEQQGIALTDPLAFFARLMMRRAAPDTDERVVQELVRDMTPTAQAQIVYSYARGVLADPKALLAAVQGTQGQMTSALLAQLASATMPSLPTSTALPSGSSETTPPATSTA